MRRELIHIDRVGWDVVIFVGVTCKHTAIVMRDLHAIGCTGEDAEASIANLDSCRLNNGITYSNYARRVSVIVIGKTTTPAEFVSSFVHESIHLANHIAEALEMDIQGEFIAYTVGEFAREGYSRFFG